MSRSYDGPIELSSPPCRAVLPGSQIEPRSRPWLLLVLIGLLVWAGGCRRSTAIPTQVAALPPTAGSAATVMAGSSAPPQVVVHIEPAATIHSGDPVQISVQAAPGTDDESAASPIVAFRLSIDGSSTGWEDIARLPGRSLTLLWTAPEAGEYQIVGQAQNRDRVIGENQRTLRVEARPPTPSATHASPTAISATLRVHTAANLRDGPSSDHAIVGSAEVGAQLTIRDRHGSWWQVDMGDAAGWIHGDLVDVEPLEHTTPLLDDLEVTATPTPPLAADAGQVPAPAPVGTVVVYESSVTLPTYPSHAYQQPDLDLEFQWPYLRFDWERFEAERPEPIAQSYRLLVLENAYLRVTFLPELGGRIWQAIHKPTGANMFYQNAVVKPSPWGPAAQRGWLAIGGLEWNLPVIEHGYDWGTQWGYLPLQHSEELASVTVFTPQDGRRLGASITVSLRAGAAAFEIEPTVTNLAAAELEFHYWHDALLAPGLANKPSASLRFIVPGESMTLHSSQDSRLPSPQQPFTWPLVDGRDLSRLGNWSSYLGFFERPAARGPFVAVYDTLQDAGAVRLFPAQVAQGSKIFGLGYGAPLPSTTYTDDDSAYVELHGGLAPTFFEPYRLPPAGTISWREVWYPVAGIGDLTYANESGAVAVKALPAGLQVGLYPTRPISGALVARIDGRELARQPIAVSPEQPFLALLVPAAQLPAQGPVEIRLEDAAGRALFTYTFRDRLTP